MTPEGALAGGGAARDVAARIAVTLAAIAVYRIGTFVPLPGLDPAEVARFVGGSDGNLLPERLSIFSLGVVPVISSLILFELLLLVVPRLRGRHQTGGADAPFNTKVAGLALLFAAFQASGVATALESVPDLVPEPGSMFRLAFIATMVAATAALMWLADVITRHGIGSGVWVLFLAPLLSQAVSTAGTLALHAGASGPGAPVLLAMAAYTVAVAAGLVALERAMPGLAASGHLLWPPILAGAALGWLIVPVMPFLEPASLERLTAAFTPGAVPRLAGLAVLVPLFTLWRIKSFATSGAGSPVTAPAALALGLAAAVVGGEVFLAFARLPPVLDGGTLAVVMTVALAFLTRNFR